MSGLVERRTADLTIFFVALVLLGIGTLMVFSSSSVHALVRFDDPYHFLKRQLLWTAVGVSAMILAIRIDYWHLKRIARPLLYGALLLLIAVLLSGVGDVGGGSRRWIDFGFFNFQPSEAIKLAMIIYMAAALADTRERLQDFVHGLGPHLLLLGGIFALIMLQPDLGTAVAIAGTFLVLLFVAGVNLLHLAAISLTAVPGIAYLVVTESYRMRRILAFLQPELDPANVGYQILQSLYALGSGGLFGVGLGQSHQKYFYLPAQHTDFIFSILGEELGFLGAGAVVVLFFLFAWRGYRVAVQVKDGFGSLLAVGITTMITLQAVINVAVVTSLLPTTGIPLPLISYGGSSLVFTLFGVGLLLNISKHLEE